ncbi:alpha-tocopherol transfer protein-like [Haematobia irritans]|uniref:alpha-tocopherol transfer protein-like n=1 Tax=Haematobia irritans TaxID=7368 RepID=UPI003F4F7F17
MANIRPLSEELQKAAIELGEVPSRMSQDLAALKEWIQQQPHLKANMDDQFLVAFLRGCKYSLEKAKGKIDKFYTLRTKFPELFCTFDVDDPKFRELFRLGILLYLPNPLNENGPRIALMRIQKFPVDKYPGEDVMRVVYALQEILLLEDDRALLNGLILINDLENVTMPHYLYMSPAMIKKLTVFSEQAVPLRPKATHFINTPGSFEKMYNMLKPVFSAKQQSRMFVHGTKLDLLTEIPLKYFPKEYGGENGSIPEILDDWEKKLDFYRDHFKKNAEYGTDEKLRQGNAIDFNSLFGIDGSFRKLDVD